MSSVSPRFRRVIEERTGLDLSRRDEGWLTALVGSLVAETKCSSVDHLVDRLSSEGLESPLWTLALDRLTISETYFFRDMGQIELLRHQILPRLTDQAQGRPLRIWSAGCSTGEELYTLAMLADSAGVKAELMGTDINPEVLSQARRGVYRERSLRNLPGEFRDQYLLTKADGFEVVSRLRERTRFMPHNLSDKIHTLGFFDLIVCRNVLIYFTRESLASILESFHSSLRPGGLLLTGHGELMGVPSPFEVLHFPESLIYLRPESPKAATSLDTSVTRPSRLRELAVPHLEVSDPAEHASPEVGSLCRQGRAARLAGDREKARDLFRQALYLDPDHIPVFLEKSLLWVEEDPERARKDYATALDLLACKPKERRLRDDVALPLAELERRRI